MPILAGIAWLATALFSLITGLVAFLVGYLTKRFLIVAAAVVVIIALTAAMWAGLESLVSGITSSMPSAIQAGVNMMMPSNLTACIAIIIAAKLLKYAYDWNVRVVQMKLGA